MVKLVRNGDPVASPDGSLFVFTKTTYDDDGNSNVVMSLRNIEDTEFEEEVCKGGLFPGNPTWLDNKMLLLTATDGDTGINQVWSYNIETKKCTQLTFYPISVDNLKVSPMNNYIVFSAEVYFGMDLEGTAQEERYKSELPYKAYLWTDPYIRHWDSWIEPDKWFHLFYTPITYDGNGTVVIDSEQSPIDIMADFDSDSPMRPFGDRTQYDISPDGTKIAFVTQTGVERAWNTDDMIYIADIVLSDQMNIGDEEEEKYTRINTTCITCEDNKYKYYNARAATPLFINDDVLVFLGMEEEQSESDLARLVRYNLDSNTFNFISNGFDFTISSVALDKSSVNVVGEGDNKDVEFTLYLVVSHYARERVFRYSSVSKEYVQLTSDGSVTGVNVIHGSAGELILLYSLNRFVHPAEIFVSVYESDDSEKCLTTEKYTHDNEKIFDMSKLVTQGEFTVKNKLNDSQFEGVQSFYFLPKDFDESNPPPLILYIHGGPESPWYDGWSFRWNPQVWVSEGYSLVLTNFHGSDSFGKAFTEEILGDWFGEMYEDIKDGMNWMLEKKYGDPNRIATAGASFGCNTIYWILGHNDVNSIVNVCHDGVFDTRMSATDTEELFFPIREFGGKVYDPETRAKYDEKNPSLYVSEWNTPTLVIHGGQDFRIPETHGLAAFQALRRRGVEAKFLYFPTQSHWVYSPRESVVWHNTVMEWLADHLKNVTEKN